MNMLKVLTKKAGTLILSTAILAAAILPSNNIAFGAETLEFNYAKALQYSQYFYDANMCGTEVTEKKWIQLEK